MAFGNRGTIFQSGSLMQINNAFVEEVSASGNAGGFILVSYVSRASNGNTSLSYLRLNVGRNTVILNTGGGSICLHGIREGMWIDAIFSPQMTRSIPPQSNAFLILVRKELPILSNTTEARILSVDPEKNSILAGEAGNRNRQTLFLITDTTLIRNRSGNPIRLSSLQPGQLAKIVHANFQTASIPPQTTAYYIQVI